jgi:molybdate transport system substrate-binding protein
MRLKRIILVTLLCLVVTVGVLTFVRAADAATVLIVHAGAALRPALDEAAAAFEKQTGTRIDYNYKGSGCLLPDVCVSQKGDAYLPGELYFMQQAVDRKLVNPDYKVVATMTTVIIVQSGNPKKIRTLQDFAKPGVRIGLGDPESVAIGRAARECLVRAGVWGKAKGNIIMTSQNVSELTNAVKMKHIDASIVWDATAALYNGKEMVSLAIPAKYTVCSPVPVGALKFTKHGKETQQYVDFLASSEGTKIFVKHGFGAPPESRVACKTGRK